MNKFKMIACSLIAIQLAACGSDPVAETEAKIQEIESSVKADPVEDVAQASVSPVSFLHDQSRNPFVPESLYLLMQKPSRVAAPVDNPNRRKTALEGYELADLYFIGLVKRNGKTQGLIETPQKNIFTVNLGSYVGDSNGRVSKITTDGILINEVRPNGVGGYYVHEEFVSAKPSVVQKVDKFGTVIQPTVGETGANYQQPPAQSR